MGQSVCFQLSDEARWLAPIYLAVFYQTHSNTRVLDYIILITLLDPNLLTGCRTAVVYAPESS